MPESKIVDTYGRPYNPESSNTEATNIEIARIIEGTGFGRMQMENMAGALVKTENREDEAIIGQAAKEFGEEGKLHPERYDYIAKHVKEMVEKNGLKNPLIMDFGSGPGLLTSMISKEIPEARVIGVDLSDDMLAIAKSNIESQGLEKRIQLVSYNVKEVSGNSGQLADIVVSRNMLHRLDSLEAGLMSMIRSAKDHGGMVLNTSFRNLNDLNPEEQQKWIQAFHERDGYPKLQEAWVLAYLNAPTLAEYQTVAKRIAENIDAKEMMVTAGDHNEVNIFFKKK
jgi:ubiquinone/menaquinone biosynthesis C-methylase UbiE